jgi:hypothetical protein
MTIVDQDEGPKCGIAPDIDHVVRPCRASMPCVPVRGERIARVEAKQLSPEQGELLSAGAGRIDTVL